MYAPHSRSCSAPSYLVPTEGVDVERREFAGKSSESWRGRERVTPTTGTTVAAWKQGGPTTGRLPLVHGLPVYKPLNQGLAAYNMNTGEKLWDVAVGQTPEQITNHPLLKGVDVPNVAEVPIPGQYGMMTYLHRGKQYIIVQAGSARRNQPGSLVALTLP